MKAHLVIHLLPQELDWFEWQAKQLNAGTIFLDREWQITVDVTLNLNLVDWNNSLLSKNFFIEKFNGLKKYFDWCQLLFEINDDKTCMGVNDKRRNSIRHQLQVDYFLFLDADVVFKPETLATILMSTKLTVGDYFVISPQVPKLWDVYWDPLVNAVYINEPYGFEQKFNAFSVLSTNYGSFTLNQLVGYKFGGGLFNLFSSSLLYFADIPEELGCYGNDDSYLVYCCCAMRMRNIPVTQYLVNNLVVAENYKYRGSVYDRLLLSTSDREQNVDVSEKALEAIFGAHFRLGDIKLNPESKLYSKIDGLVNRQH